MDEFPEHYSIVEFDVENGRMTGRLSTFRWDAETATAEHLEAWDGFSIILVADEYGRLTPGPFCHQELADNWNPIYTKAGKLWWPRD